MLVQLGPQVARDPLAEHRHQPQPHVRRGLAYDVQRRHGPHREPRQTSGFDSTEQSGLRRPNDLVEQEAGEVRRYETGQCDDRGCHQTDGHLAPIRRQVTEQAEDHRRLTSGDERLCIAHRARDCVRVHAIGVRRGRGHDATGERLLEHEANVLERAALTLRVAHECERVFVRLAEHQQRVRTESGRQLQPADLPARDRLNVPRPTWRRAGNGDVTIAQRYPGLAEDQRVVEVGECVQPDRLRLPLQFNARAQLVGETRWLAYIATDDFVIHGRDPLRVARANKKAFRSAEAPERPDHDIESCSSRVLDLRRRKRRKSAFQGTLSPGASTRAAWCGGSKR